MPVVMKITLLLLLFGGVWSEGVALTTPEAPNLSSATSIHKATSVPEKNGHTGHQTGTIHYAISEVSSPKTFTISSGPPVSKPTISQEVSTKESTTVLETSTETSNPTVSAMRRPGPPDMTGGTMAASHLDTFNGTSGPPVTMTNRSLEASNGTFNGTSGPPVTMTNGSLEASSWINGTIGPSDIMTSSSLETSDGTSGPPITTLAASSPMTPKGTSGSPISRVKISTISTPEPSTKTGSRPSPSSDQGTNNTLLVAVFVAVLVVIVLLALLLLWRQRQKRRTGALTLSGGGKSNGVVDAWVGPARVSDEEAVITTAGVSGGGDKGSGVPDGEGSGRRPTLTTFFGRRKSHQGSLALEELKAGSAVSIKGEEVPLVGSEDGALEAPSSDEPEVGNVEVL
ncbi:PREDICTED: leukosialin [Hipposideros armiger]|uniref:Leukosialin n=1 Tax=Hipposideros armiger TaxID=186990 RepID=A0A8B7Q662_HIPAR|nr:PREDICTED: leukosialin [Hipposideros armiger]